MGVTNLTMFLKSFTKDFNILGWESQKARWENLVEHSSGLMGDSNVNKNFQDLHNKLSGENQEILFFLLMPENQLLNFLPYFMK